jgi:hypothetical protein
MALGQTVMSVNEKIRIQNWYSHVLVVPLTHAVTRALLQPQTFQFVGINNVILRSNQSFRQGDTLDINFFIEETGQKHLLLNFDLYQCNKAGIQYAFTGNRTNYIALPQIARSVAITFQTNIGANRIFDPFKLNLEIVVRN